MIQKPNEEEFHANDFCNRKGYYGVAVQACVDSDYKIMARARSLSLQIVRDQLMMLK